jgi:hypothetical protein
MTEWVWATSMADHADTNSPYGNPRRDVFANILVDQFNSLSLDPDDLFKFAG